MKKITLIVLATLGLGAASVQADNIFTTGTPYLGGGIGYGNVLALAGDGVDNGGFAYNFFGGYLVNATKNLQMGLEVGYTGYSDVTSSTTASVLHLTTTTTGTVSTYAVNILGVAKYNFDQSSLYLIGKVGVGIVNQLASLNETITNTHKNTSSSSTIAAADETNGNAVIVGGLGYKWTSHIATDVTVNYTFGSNANSTSTVDDTSALLAVMANLTYSF